MSILLRCFLTPDKMSLLVAGENRENSVSSLLVGYAQELVFRNLALS